MQASKVVKEPISPHLNEVSRKIVDSAYSVHIKLGPGLLESVYEACLIHELKKRGLTVESQLVLPIDYDGLIIKSGYRLDLLVEKQVIAEIKNVETILPVHRSQILTYLKLSGHRLGLLINFNTPLLKDGIIRVVR